MEKYLTLNIAEEYHFENMLFIEEQLKCWLLFQTNMETGVELKITSSTGPLFKLKHVLPESLHLILFESGKYYQMENLLGEVEDHCLDLDKMFAKRNICFGEFGEDDDSEDEEIEDYLESIGVECAWLSPEEEDFSEVIVNENGCCIFRPLEDLCCKTGSYWSEETSQPLEIYYRPNIKRLSEAAIDHITCNIVCYLGYFVTDHKLGIDYKQYFVNTLDDSQMELSHEESLELYHTLCECADQFTIAGGETVFYKRDRAADCSFIQDGRAKFIRGMNTQVIYEAWIKGRLKKVLDRAIVMGILEEVESLTGHLFWKEVSKTL